MDAEVNCEDVGTYAGDYKRLYHKIEVPSSKEHSMLLEHKKGTCLNLNTFWVFRDVFLHKRIAEMDKLVELIQREKMGSVEKGWMRRRGFPGGLEQQL